jgi:hypothetical protein
VTQGQVTRDPVPVEMAGIKEQPKEEEEGEDKEEEERERKEGKKKEKKRKRRGFRDPTKSRIFQ